MKRIIILTTIILLKTIIIPIQTSAQGLATMTLDSCLRYAYSHNATMQSAQMNNESALVALSGAKMNFLPSVNASASKGWNRSDGISSSNGSYGINAGITLFNGLNNIRTLQQAQTTQSQRELQMQQTQNSITSSIISAYLTILMNEERLIFEQEVLETSRQQQLEGQLKYEVGRILESDYQLLYANYLSAQAEIENIQLTIQNNYDELQSLLCLPPGQSFRVAPWPDTIETDKITIAPYETLLSQAQEVLPDWEISRMNVRLARLNVDLTRSSFMPSLSLNGGVAYYDGSSTASSGTITNGGFNSSLTLSLNVPIFDRGASVTQYRQSKISLRQAEVSHIQDSIDIENNIHSHYLETCKALNNFKSTQALSDAYHSSYQVYLLKYKEGAITTVEMLQQQDRYLSSLNDYLQSKYSYILSQKMLDICTGH